MSDVRATALRKVMAVERTADGKAVVFAFEDIKGGRHVFAMPAHEIAELVGKFVKAAKTARRTGETPLAPVVDNFEVAGSIAERQVQRVFLKRSVLRPRNSWESQFVKTNHH